MKQYDEIFVIHFSVQQLANKLLESYLGEMPMPHIEEVQAVASGLSDLNVPEELEMKCKHYMQDYYHYERLVESIVDSVKDNQNSCANIFNALNGWVKFDVPKLKRHFHNGVWVWDDITEEFTVDPNYIRNGYAVDKLSDTELEKNIYYVKEQIKDEIEDEKIQNELGDWLNLLQVEWNNRNHY